MKNTIKTLMAISAAAVLMTSCENDRKPANPVPPPSENSGSDTEYTDPNTNNS